MSLSEHAFPCTLDVDLPVSPEVSSPGDTDCHQAPPPAACQSDLHFCKWPVAFGSWKGTHSLSQVTMQQVPLLRLLRGLLLSGMGLHDLLHQPPSHNALLQIRGKKIREVSITGMFGAVPKYSTHTGWGGEWGQGCNWRCAICGASKGNSPRSMCKGLSFDCPELLILVSVGDTIITPPWLNQSYYLTGNMLTWFSSHSAGLDGLESIFFGAAIPSCPAGAVSRHGSQHGQQGSLHWGASKPGFLEKPCGQPFCKPRLSLNKCRKRVLVLAAQLEQGRLK